MLFFAESDPHTSKTEHRKHTTDPLVFQKSPPRVIHGHYKTVNVTSMPGKLEELMCIKNLLAFFKDIKKHADDIVHA